MRRLSLTSATAIAARWIAGTTSMGDRSRAARYDIRTGRVVDLGALSADGQSFANGVSRRGDVVGLSDTEDGFSPFFVDRRSGRMVSMGDLGQPFGAAYDINDHRVAVGYAEIDENFTSRAFVWTPTDGMTDLNSLIEPGGRWVLLGASGIDNRGQIVGWGTYRGRPRAFLLTPVAGNDGLGARYSIVEAQG